MHRIDTTGHVGNLFVPKNVATGQRGTLIGYEWLNDLQENVARAIEAAGIALSKGDYGQLTEAIRNIGSAGAGGLGNMLINPDFAVWQRLTNAPAADGQRTQTGIASGSYVWDRWRFSNTFPGTPALSCYDNWAKGGGYGHRIATLYPTGDPSGATYPVVMKLAQRIEHAHLYFGEKVTFACTLKRGGDVPASTNYRAELTINYGTASGAGSPQTLVGTEYPATTTSTLRSWTFDIPTPASSIVKPRLVDDSYIEIALVVEYNEDALGALLNEHFVSGPWFGIGAAAPKFRPRPQWFERAACERFYQRSYPWDLLNAATSFLGASRGQDQGTIAQSLCSRFRIPMRATPTVKWYSPSTGTVDKLHWNGSDITATGTNHASQESTGEPTVGSSQSQSSVYAHWTAEAEL